MAEMPGTIAWAYFKILAWSHCWSSNSQKARLVPENSSTENPRLSVGIRWTMLTTGFERSFLLQFRSINVFYCRCKRKCCRFYLRNRKHVPCCYRVIQTRVEVWENEKCCGNMSPRRVFPQLFRVLPNFHECLYNSIETRSTCFLFLLENNGTRKRKNNLLTLIIKM